jgi:hypothetical protein
MFRVDWSLLPTPYLHPNNEYPQPLSFEGFAIPRHTFVNVLLNDGTLMARPLTKNKSSTKN